MNDLDQLIQELTVNAGYTHPVSLSIDQSIELMKVKEQRRQNELLSRLLNKVLEEEG